MILRADIAIIGAGAAGLMAAIWAGRTDPSRRIVLLDGAAHIGAKILVSGGGRCNVTHHHVDERAFAGSTRPAIRKVLLRFDVPRVIEFFSELGVEFKREETGKLFPTTDKARTVLDALLRAARDAGVELRHPWRVTAIKKVSDTFSGPSEEKVSDTFFRIAGAAGGIEAGRVIIATGGRSLPKTGSDGKGYELVQGLGHSITPRVFPALVPLTLPTDHFIRDLSGVTLPAMLELRAASGKRLVSFTDSTLCTHFGLSGPSVLDISRYYLDARFEDAGASLAINWLPGERAETIDALLLNNPNGVSPGRLLRERGLPDRLAKALCQQARVDPSASAKQLSRQQRQTLAKLVTNTPLPITGDRGFAVAEVTAGGVPLNELHLETMESRVCPGLYVIGEICDVDGRIGGFNFQWAWASGYVAGAAAAKILSTRTHDQEKSKPRMDTDSHG
jgi:predicted Rossmann fold flavoprotein